METSSVLAFREVITGRSQMSICRECTSDETSTHIQRGWYDHMWHKPPFCLLYCTTTLYDITTTLYDITTTLYDITDTKLGKINSVLGYVRQGVGCGRGGMGAEWGTHSQHSCSNIHEVFSTAGFMGKWLKTNLQCCNIEYSLYTKCQFPQKVHGHIQKNLVSKYLVHYIPPLLDGRYSSFCPCVYLMYINQP